MTDEKICIDKDGNEVDCGSVKAVRQLTHDDAKAFRKANKGKAEETPEAESVEAVEPEEEKATAKTEDKAVPKAKNKGA